MGAAISGVVFAFFLLIITGMESAAEDSQPVARIEAGMHTGMINRISSDAAGRLALTVSDDKTARLWEVSTGRLVRILRVPFGSGREGQLHCGALSPDGRLAAVGGFTSPDGGERHVYLFDTATGGLVTLINEAERQDDLAFSADGRYLAGALHSGGVRVWQTATGQVVGRDTEYADQSYGVDWSGNNQIVTSCWDGNLRLYSLNDGAAGPKLDLIKKSAVKGGHQPFSARFSPDGKWIAVGFADSAAVTVVNAKNLSFEFAPDISGIDNRDLLAVCWARDGGTLAAGGTWKNDGTICIRLWPQAGRGEPTDIPVAKNTIMDFRALPEDRFLFCAADPVWGVLAKDGSKQILGKSPKADYRNKRGGFGVSADGERVGFGFEYWGESPAQFSISQRNLITDSKTFESLDGPVLSGIDVADWEDNLKPQLGGKSLPLMKYERSRSLAIAHDHSFFLLGADWYLYCFSSTGEKRWNIQSPGTNWAVNLDDQGRLAVAACGDGTIRWYRVQDGKELLAFFPHADKKRWVLWTPEGYYDCSTGGEDLTGWQVNRGQDHEADFFPGSKFRDQFYRPDVIQRVLSTLDVDQALAQANAERGRQEVQSAPKIEEVINRMQPPKIELVTGGTLGEMTLEPGAKNFTVHYRVVRGSGEPVERVMVFVDGRPVEDAKAEIPASDSAEVSATTPVPEHNCVLTLIAKNRFAFSESARLQLKRAPGDLDNSLKPKVYLLAVGISHYINKDQQPDLHFADKDAKDFAAVFGRQAQRGGLYQCLDVKMLTDEGATASNILDGLDWIKDETTSKDVAIVFFSGHGENDEQLNFYLCPHDYDNKHRSRTGVSDAQITKSVGSIAGKLLFFIDACHAGNALGKLAFKGDDRVDITQVVNELSSAENGAIVYASSTGTQLSQELQEEQNGAFTKALVEGLDGQADLLHEGVITVASLETYVDERVKHLTKGGQSPSMAKPSTVPNYPIAIKR